MKLSIKYLKARLTYDPLTGSFVWKPRPIEQFKTRRAFGKWNARYAGKVAGALLVSGHVSIIIDYAPYLAHRLAWFYMTGEWPREEIDHRDTNGSNNIWENLRQATSLQNKGNMRLPSHNRSGLKGVSWTSREQKWRAVIADKHLGYFNCPTAAHFAYCRAAKAYFGIFARTE